MKTRGQCYYFCYDTHSFNNPSVHILSAGIHVLAFQGSICPLIKADIMLLSLVSNSALLMWFLITVTSERLPTLLCGKELLQKDQRH